MAHEVLLPKQGNSVESCIIVEWSVSEGDTVSEGDKLCEVETDKATFEVESTAGGTVLKLLYAAGDEAPVMQPICVVGEAGEQVDVSSAAAGSSGAGGGAVTRGGAGGARGGAGGARGGAGGARGGASQADGGAGGAGDPGAPGRGARGAAGGGEAAGSGGAGARGGAGGARGGASGGGGAGGAGAEVAARTAGGRVRVSPRARLRAAEAGVDPSKLSGSGPGGRVLVRDVEQAIESGGAPAAAGAPSGAAGRGTSAGAAAGAGSSGAAAAGGSPSGAGRPVSGAPNLGEPAVAGETPLRGIRARIAERMHASLRDTAQLTMEMSGDARGLQRLRARFKAEAEKFDIPSVSIGEMVAFAAARTLTRHTALNSHMLEDRIVHYSDVHLGLAVDTPRGLLVPTIRGANGRSLVSLAEEGRRMAHAARDGNINPDDLSGATFTITNLGATGVTHFTPVLNPPQVAILGVGGIRAEPVFTDGKAGALDSTVEHIPVIGLSLTIDHRAVDGAPAARFLKEVCEAIASIELMLAT